MKTLLEQIAFFKLTISLLLLVATIPIVWTGKIEIIDAATRFGVASSTSRDLTKADGVEDPLGYKLCRSGSLPAASNTSKAKLGDFGNFDNAFVGAQAKTPLISTMTFRSFVDGSDFVHVKGSQVWYEHRNYQFPGLSDGSNEPTYINGDQWFPTWSGNLSNRYSMLNPPLSNEGMFNTMLTDVSSGELYHSGSTTLIQSPTAANGYEAIILLDDDEHPGTDWYSFTLHTLTAVNDFTCPKDTTVYTRRGFCDALVSGIPPNTTGDSTEISYALSGATTGSGIGPVSGFSFNKGITTVTYSETINPANSCSFTVTVEDNEVPLLSNITTSLLNIWPPNNKLVNVKLNYTDADNCGAVSTVLSITSNEKTPARHNEIHWVIINDHLVQLRAEKGKNPKYRVYTITVTATDASANQTVKSVIIGVDKNPSPGFLTSHKPGAIEQIDEALQVKVSPNPSASYFTIATSSKNTEKITIRVLNETGAVVETVTNLLPGGQVRVGNAYPNGLYVAEFIQGTQRVVVKLLKRP